MSLCVARVFARTFSRIPHKIVANSISNQQFAMRRGAMRGRRKSGAAEDLMNLVALLPWWLAPGLALAPQSYWLLNGAASRPIPPAQTAKQISELPPTMLWQGFTRARAIRLIQPRPPARPRRLSKRRLCDRPEPRRRLFLRIPRQTTIQAGQKTHGAASSQARRCARQGFVGLLELFWMPRNT